MMYEGQTVNIYDPRNVECPVMMKTDIQEKDGSYLLEIELPGFSREDVQAQLKEGILTIIANKTETIETENKKINYICRERYVSGCKRSFFVGGKIRQEDITAAFKDGILSIIISNPDKTVDREEQKLIPIM